MGTLLGVLLGVLLLLIVLVLLFVQFAPVFGAKPSKAQREAYEAYPNYSRGRFHNLMPQFTVTESSEFIDDSLHNKAERRPDQPLPYLKPSPEDIVATSEHARLLWFGHSTFLIEIDGVRLLLDPMMSDYPSPLPPFGGKRFAEGLPLEIEELPPIDAILFTHDHYDHLDYQSVLQLKGKVSRYIVPVGMSAHLLRWGIPKQQIRELNWYETAKVENVEVIFTPSHHYTGRSWRDRFQSLWGGWVILGQEQRLYVSGDGGYGPHFKRVGEEYGPFDLALVECGQYSRYWRQNHLFPEQAANVGQDVQAKLMMPIHWGGFALAMHRWTDPPERFLIRAHDLGIPVTTPRIGEYLVLDPEEEPPMERWWRKLE